MFVLDLVFAAVFIIESRFFTHSFNALENYCPHAGRLGIQATTYNEELGLNPCRTSVRGGTVWLWKNGSLGSETATVQNLQSTVCATTHEKILELTPFWDNTNGCTQQLAPGTTKFSQGSVSVKLVKWIVGQPIGVRRSQIWTAISGVLYRPCQPSKRERLVH